MPDEKNKKNWEKKQEFAFEMDVGHPSCVCSCHLYDCASIHSPTAF
jgi:hypothetical protein